MIFFKFAIWTVSFQMKKNFIHPYRCITDPSRWRNFFFKFPVWPISLQMKNKIYSSLQMNYICFQMKFFFFKYAVWRISLQMKKRCIHPYRWIRDAYRITDLTDEETDFFLNLPYERYPYRWKKRWFIPTDELQILKELQILTEEEEDFSFKFAIWTISLQLKKRLEQMSFYDICWLEYAIKWNFKKLRNYKKCIHKISFKDIRINKEDSLSREFNTQRGHTESKKMKWKQKISYLMSLNESMAK